jgi:hypothetical protein
MKDYCKSFLTDCIFKKALYYLISIVCPALDVSEKTFERFQCYKMIKISICLGLDILYLDVFV